MDNNLFSRVSRTQLRLKPFPHFVIENALSDSLYEKLDNTFPEEFLIEDNTLVKKDRGHTRRLLYKDFKNSSFVDDIWKEFANVHCSKNFFRIVTNYFFEQSLQDIYPTLSDKINQLDVQLRTNDPEKDKNSVVTDFQFVANLPYGESHTSRTPHLDNPKEIYACLFYMRKKNDSSIGGGLDFYQAKKSALEAQHTNERAVNLDHLKYSKTVHYAKNTAVIFLNTRASYHGVQQIYNQNLCRRSINIIGELPLGSRLFTV